MVFIWQLAPGFFQTSKTNEGNSFVALEEAQFFHSLVFPPRRCRIYGRMIFLRGDIICMTYVDRGSLYIIGFAWTFKKHGVQSSKAGQGLDEASWDDFP